MWNHRVIRTKESTGDYAYGVAEVYYTKGGRINGWTDSVAPYGNDMKDLRLEIRHFAAALKKPVLEEKTVRGKLRLVVVSDD